MSALAAKTCALRDYRPSDFERLCEIDRICFPPQVAYEPEQMRETVDTDGAVIVVAESQSETIAGFAVGVSMHNSGHVITLDVVPNWRRSGIGTLLVEHVEHRLFQRGAELVRLETAKANAQAQEFFGKLGYQRIGEIKDYYPDGSDAWVMEKKLIKAT